MEGEEKGGLEEGAVCMELFSEGLCLTLSCSQVSPILPVKEFNATFLCILKEFKSLSFENIFLKCKCPWEG